MALTQDYILTFLLESDGRVKNSELVNKFKGLLSSNDPAENKQKRDLFKRLVNSVAVVKQVEDVKYVVVKKKYQGCVKGENTSHGLFDFPSPCRVSSTSESSDIKNADIINNNYSPTATQDYKKENSTNSDAETVHSGRPSESLTTRVLNVTSGAGGDKRRSVFALVAVKPPSDFKPHHLPSKVTDEKTRSAVAGHGFPYRSLRVKRKELEAQGSPQMRRVNKIIRCGSNEVRDWDVIPLGPTEHKWLVKSATGSWHQIRSLLIQEPQLAAKPNFMSGFTILHWAAKSGNGEMVREVMDVSRQHGVVVNVNAKSYDGYTPLHVAAIHSHVGVLSLLVCEFKANTNIRDNSGKKPHHYLSQDVSCEIRKLLGDPRDPLQSSRCFLRDEQRGFSTLTKLFQPNVAGPKKKHTRRSSFHFIREDHEDHRKNTTLHSKLSKCPK